MRTFYLDAENGNDRRAGTSPETAWRTLKRAMRQRLRPGDSLLLKRGGTWREPLRIRGRGAKGRPITLGTYGGGPKPRLVSSVFPVLGNAGPISWWHIKGLELRGTQAFDPHGQTQGGDHGIFISQADPCDGLVLEDCVVHDINGKGIVLNTAVNHKSVFRNWRITGCEVYNAGTGIATDGPWPPPKDLTRCFRCHAGFQVDGCRVHDIATDGIVLYYCQDGVIERCTAWRTGIGKWHRTPVGIWYFMAAHCVIQFCESFDNHPAGGHADGGGFDLDGGCVDCTLQYNYSHDNAGAGYLVCSYDPKTAPCLRCTVRFNLSVNDGRMNDFAAIQFWQADDCRVYNNTCVTRVGHGLKFASETKGNLFANNLFLVGSGADTACVKSPFAIAANRFRNNLYWRLDGKPRFEVLDRLRLSWREFQALAGTRGERCAAPRLTAQSGPDIRLQKDSPALGAGVRLPDMGDRDLYNAPVRKSGPVAIGAAQGMSR